ncbi:hypothetical protein F5051DRAFT_245336 [Lentinula edodes]|nr:hypothetical protein F5051DRAFT_245336 [Lentinula edodes]
MSLQKLHANTLDQEYIMQMNNQFEKVRSFRFYKTEDTGSEFNVLCIAGKCHSNCELGCSFPFTLDPETLARSCYCFEEKPGVAPLQRRCNFCGHLVGDHRHYRAKWEEKWRHELMIDSESKIRFDLAKTESEKTAIIMDVEKKELAQLEQDITASMKEVRYLCEKFNKLSLSGRFTLYISAATHLLKLREHEMERDGADTEDIKRIAGWIERWGKKKKVLEEAEK